VNEAHKAALGARLRRIRTQQGLTQDTVSKACQVHTNTVRVWEQGRVAYHPWRAPQIAAALGVPIAQLFVDEPVLAEIRLSEATLQAVRDQGRGASEAAAGRIAAQLEPLIFQAATRPKPDGRAQRRRTRPEKLNIPKSKPLRRTVD
jgi:transcriptional regulator with XRE-family HTH domain